jgi:hypothetical protein
MKRSLILALMVTSLAASAAFVLIAPGCAMTNNRSIDVARLGPANRVEVYEGGRPMVDRTVAAGSPEERAIADWLQSHSSGWQATRVTYAPGRTIRGDHFRLNFVAGRCVLNYRANERGDWVQVSRPIREGESIPDVFDRGK